MDTAAAGSAGCSVTGRATSTPPCACHTKPARSASDNLAGNSLEHLLFDTVSYDSSVVVLSAGVWIEMSAIGLLLAWCQI
jgi:hypothetical protein